MHLHLGITPKMNGRFSRQEWDENRTWHGRCIHPKMHVVPERIRPISPLTNPDLLLSLGLPTLLLLLQLL